MHHHFLSASQKLRVHPEIWCLSADCGFTAGPFPLLCAHRAALYQGHLFLRFSPGPAGVVKAKQRTFFPVIRGAAGDLVGYCVRDPGLKAPSRHCRTEEDNLKAHPSRQWGGGADRGRVAIRDEALEKIRSHCFAGCAHPCGDGLLFSQTVAPGYATEPRRAEIHHAPRVVSLL